MTCSLSARIASILIMISSSFCIAFAEDWAPADPALLAQKSPTIEKDADAEGVFWDVRIEGASGNVEISNYIRIKVFTERGKELASKVEIAYLDNYEVKDLEGRTIKPDGSIIEIQKNSIFEKTLASTRHIKLKTKTMPFPAIEPGVVIEYRWKETRPLQDYSRYYLQRDIPFQKISYHIKSNQSALYSALRIGMNTATFNWPPIALQKDSKGFMWFELHNVPAFKEEPQMPPEDSIRAFLLVFYRYDKVFDPKTFWNDYGKSRYKYSQNWFKPNSDIIKTTLEVIGSSTQQDEIVEKIIQFIRSKVKNVYDDASGLTSKEREKGFKNNNPSDTLKNGKGTTTNIIMLFASMASAAGLEVRAAVTSDRSDFYFNTTFADTYFINYTIIAIKSGNDWKYYDPASAYLPYDMMYWGVEGSKTLVPDENEPFFVTTPLSPPEKSQEKRNAKLNLSDDGTLDGDVTIEYTGHIGAYRKEYNDDESPTRREEIVKNMLTNRISAAEVTNIRIENITDSDKPFIYRFHLRIPNYAQRTGKRLFFQPLFFQKGDKPLFLASQRKYDIDFHYPWAELDDIEISLPEGYELESPEVRSPIVAGNVARHELQLGLSNDQRVLLCRRIFSFGSKQGILFGVKQYAALKQYFDSVHSADHYVLSLKQTAVAK